MPPADRWTVRIWPGALILALVVGLMTLPGLIAPRTMLHFMAFMAGPFLGIVLAIVWWTAFSRTRGSIRWSILALYLVPMLLLSALDILDKKPPMAAIVFGAPLVLLLWVGWLAASFVLNSTVRQAGLAFWMATGWIAFGMLRLDGTDAEMLPEFSFRFSPKPEDRAAEESKNRPTVVPAKPLSESKRDGADWAGFRGPEREGIVRGVSIDTDWVKHPPKQLWKQKVGPGWGTFAVVGDRLFTQEQLGDDEAVVCYDAATGNPIWRHFEKAKFTETIAGAGPRATPTIADGKLYAVGATGILLCLKAEDGAEIWKTDITADTGGVVPQWGYSSSPLVLNGLVVVYAGGPMGKGTAAFDAGTGKLTWASGDAMHGYSSAQRTVIDGIEQILMLSDCGLESFEPKAGQRLWEYKWFIKGMNRSTQPTALGGGEFLIGTGVGSEMGTRKLRVIHDSTTWKAEVVWESPRVRPYFNDGVVHAGHLYGFDDKKLICVDLKDGSIRWDAGTKFGHGQLLLLADQGLLVIQAVDGKIHLLKAAPDEPTELGKLDAISGKTWNHPVVNRNRLYVRNGTWAAAYELSQRMPAASAK
jgi:outer membrane protein assembly factor BamB